MKKSLPLFRTLPLILVAAALLLPCSRVAFAAKSAVNETKVISVGTNSITVQTSGHKGFKITDIDPLTGKKTDEAPSNVSEFQVTTTTQITVDGLSATLADVKPGMHAIVDIGVNPNVASRITATSKVPGVPRAAANANQNQGRNAQAPPIAIGDKVIAITPTIITLGTPGRNYTHAYRVTDLTTVFVNGKASNISAVKVGMSVHVEAHDREVASSIEAHDEKKN